MSPPVVIAALGAFAALAALATMAAMPHSSPTRQHKDAPAPAPAGIAALWQLRLLGTFELADGRQRHTKLATRAAMALLARLCLRPGSAHAREELIELLWPDAPASAGRQRLRQTLSTLKQVLEPPGETTGQVLDADRVAIRLVPGSIDCDALAFEAAFRRGDHGTAQTLYAGDFMPGFFDEWIGDERLRLEGLFDRLLLPAAGQTAVSANGSAQAPAQAPAPADGTAVATPLPSPMSPQRHALPAYLTRLIGAEAQAQQLRDAVARHRLVTLLGPGGAGKTRLSVEVAQSLAAAAQDAAHGGPGGAAGPRFDTLAFVPLASCRTRQQLLDQLLLALHIGSGRAGAVDALVQALDGRPALLVLDNFEQVVDDGAELVEELGRRLPLLHLLVTSRRALALNGEREVLAAALALPASSASMAEAAANPAVALFVDRARAARAEFHLHAGNLAAVIALVQGLEGMPLAIELAAARVRSMALAEMAATLARARDGVATAGAAPAGALEMLARAPVRGRQDTRHHSMQQTIDWSWQLLSPELRALLARLTVFQGGFTTTAAQAVGAESSDNPAAAHQVPWQLDELVSHSLLRSGPATHSAVETRFTLYEPIREFAARTLAASDAAALRRRHRAWAVDWGLAMPTTPPLAALRSEWRNLGAAMVSAVADGEPATAVDIALALRPALEFVSLPGAAQASLRGAIAHGVDARRRSAALTLLAIDLLRNGQGSEGLQLAHQALELADASDPELRARALMTTAMVAFNMGERGQLLLQRMHEAQALGMAAGNAALQARVSGVLADLTGLLNRDIAGAEALHRQALRVWEAQGNALAALRSRFALAQLADAAGQYAEVLARLGPVVDTARRLQAWSILAPSLNMRVEPLAALRQWPAALDASLEAVDTAWQALDTWNALLPLLNVHVCLAHTGQPVRAQQVAGFIAHTWVQRFGALNPRSTWALRRTQRLACVQLGAAASNAAFAQGQALGLAEVVALLQQVAPR